MKLYALNTPCWSDYDTQNTAGMSLIKDKLSDHFTFMYYNFLKYGLVDEVIIFLENKRIERGIKDEVFKTDFGKMKILPASKIHEMSLEENQYVYCWSKWEECQRLSNNFVIVNPMFSGRSYPSCFNKDIHDYALIEGSAFKDTVPDWMKHQIFRYTTKDFCDITSEQRENAKKVYDWIMVSSFDPRKRHVEFISEMIKNSKTKGLKGCIVGRNPDNKGYHNAGHTVLDKIKQLTKDYNLDIDILLNVSQDTKKEVMLISRTFVCASSLDNGPRAMVEATQAGLPLISMPYIGSSDLIQPGITGELVEYFKHFPEIVLKVLENLEKYDKHKNAISLLPENVFPPLIKKIKEIKND